VSDCHYPWLSASSGTQRARDLLIRRFLYRHPDPFRSVRGLGLVNARCPGESGAVEDCSSPWLPADDSVTPWSSSPSPGLFPATRPRPVLAQALPRTRLLPNRTADGFCQGAAQPITSDAAGALDRFRLS
jgi:hypothetical protein